MRSISKSLSMVLACFVLGLLTSPHVRSQGIVDEIGKGLADLDRARLQIMGAEERPHIDVPNYDGLYFENRTSEPVYVAILSYTPADRTLGAEMDAQWLAWGWLKIAPGKTARALNRLNNRYVYYYAESRTHIWEGNKSVLVREAAFGPYDTLSTKADRLNGYVPRGFRKLDTGGATRYTLPLTGN